MKITLTKVPASESKLKAGDIVDVTGAEADTLKASGFDYQTEAEARLIKAKEVAIDNAIKASKAFAPKADTTEVRETALALESQKDGLGVTYINNLPALKASNLSGRVTASDAAGEVTERLSVGDIGMRETVRAFLQASEPEIKSQAEGRGGMIRATNKNERGITDIQAQARIKASHVQRISDMITAGADLRMDENFVKAAYDGYADPAGALGVLNTALTLNWNFGHLENMLIMIDDITTDMSGTPVHFNQQARSRYIKVPGVQLKTASNSWTGGTGNVVDVNVLMNNYAGVPITINEVLLGSTGRQLMNEQKAPQLYGLAEYILYTLINTAINGSTRFANDGVTTSTVKAASGYVDPTRGVGAFDVAGATLKTFVADLPAAMDLSKFPGGNEPLGATDLLRYAWIHTSLFSSIAGDTNFQLNQSIQGIRQDSGENLIRTGRFTQLGNAKFNKSQLVLNNNTTSGSGADGAANALTVVPGAYTAAKTVGIAGTRSGLMFVSRLPLDYTKIMPEIPSTAAIETFVTPKLGIPFLIVKHLDHAAENANMRAACMWGPAIGDERQLMLLQQA